MVNSELAPKNPVIPQMQGAPPEGYRRQTLREIAAQALNKLRQKFGLGKQPPDAQISTPTKIDTLIPPPDGTEPTGYHLFENADDTTGKTVMIKDDKNNLRGRGAPKEISAKVGSGEITIQQTAQITNPPQVETISFHNSQELVCVLYDTNALTITNGDRTMNLAAAMPDGWKLYTIDRSSYLNYTAPEVLQGLSDYQLLDAKNERVLIGPLSNESTIDINGRVSYLLYHVIGARAVKEIGMPAPGNEKATELFQAAVIERRDEILAALAGNGHNPQEILMRPFSSPVQNATSLSEVANPTTP